MLAAKLFKTCEAVGFYYETIIYHDLPAHLPTRKMFEDGAGKIDVERFSKYALQPRVQGRSFDRISEQAWNGEKASSVPGLSCLCAHIEDYYYAKDKNEYELYYRKPLWNACLPTIRC